MPEAFTKSLASGDMPQFFFNHQHDAVPPGDWVSLEVDSIGLRAVGKIDMNHNDGPMLYSGLKRGAVAGLSVGFTMGPGDFEYKEDGGRIIHSMKLFEISAVNRPCDTHAQVLAVKADLEAFGAVSDMERYLRDAGGFSRSMAKYFVSHLLKLGHGVRGEIDEAKDRETKAALAATLVNLHRKFTP